MRILPVVSFLGLSLAILQSDAQAFGDTLDELEQRLEEAAIQLDVEELLLIQEELEESFESENAARAERLWASAMHQIVFAPVEGDKMAMAREGIEVVKRSLQKDPQSVEGRLTSLWLHAYILNQGSDGDAMSEIQTLFGDLNRDHGKDPRVVFTSCIGFTNDPVPALDRAIEVFESKDPRVQSGEATWWYLSALGFAGQFRLFSANRDVPAARKLFERALELRDDFIYVKSRMSQVTPLSMTDPADIPELDFEVIAKDEAKDGSNTSLADAKSLAYAMDESSSRVWFRFEAHAPFDRSNFGVNVVIDSDDDRGNGMAWWGEHQDFHFDSIASVWVSKHTDGQYYGLVGVTDDLHASVQMMTQISANSIPFSLSEDGRTVTIALDRDHFSKTRNPLVLGAIGSSMNWNDDIGAEATPLPLVD